MRQEQDTLIIALIFWLAIESSQFSLPDLTQTAFEHLTMITYIHMFLAFLSNLPCAEAKTQTFVTIEFSGLYFKNTQQSEPWSMYQTFFIFLQWLIWWLTLPSAQRFVRSFLQLSWYIFTFSNYCYPKDKLTSCKLRFHIENFSLTY